MTMIFNGKDITLEQNSGTLPNMADTLRSWFQPMIFIGIDKTVIDYKVVETQTEISFMGVWIPKERDLKIEASGQRSWREFECYAEVGLILNTDEVICYLNKKYRVMSTEDFRLYGYVKYTLVEDYIGVLPC